MLALCLMLSKIYYAQDYADIIGLSLVYIEVRDAYCAASFNVMLMQWLLNELTIAITTCNS